MKMPLFLSLCIIPTFLWARCPSLKRAISLEGEASPLYTDSLGRKSIDVKVDDPKYRNSQVTLIISELPTLVNGRVNAIQASLSGWDTTHIAGIPSDPKSAYDFKYSEFKIEAWKHIFSSDPTESEHLVMTNASNDYGWIFSESRIRIINNQLRRVEFYENNSNVKKSICVVDYLDNTGSFF